MGFFGFGKKNKSAEDTRETIKNNENLENIGKGSQMHFAVPYFDVFDPRFMNFAVPVAVHGTVTYALENIELFKSLNRTETYGDEVFEKKIRATLTKCVKGVVCNVPQETQIPVMQMERKIMEISDIISEKVAPQMEKILGITIRNIDITNIIVDKDSVGYRSLKAVTADMEKENLIAKHQAGIDNFNQQNDLQREATRRQQEIQLGGQEQIQQMNLQHQAEMNRIQREEMQYAQRMQTNSTFSPSGVPPMPGTSTGVPPIPGATPNLPRQQYLIAINGQQMGPFAGMQLQQMVQSGQLTPQSYVWCQGMSNWQLAGQVADLACLFNAAPSGMPSEMTPPPML